MPYSPEEKRAAAEMIEAANRGPKEYPHNKIADAARSYAMAIISDQPYAEVAKRDREFLGAFRG